jgi:hypothetical protein
MKCKVCGYELEPGAQVCRMCGSSVSEVKDPELEAMSALMSAKPIEDPEMSWNTYDFPKPKKPVDIVMEWPKFNVRKKDEPVPSEEALKDAVARKATVSLMKDDATEGFVTVPASSPEPRQEKPEPVKQEPAPKPEPEYRPAAQPVRDSGLDNEFRTLSGDGRARAQQPKSSYDEDQDPLASLFFSQRRTQPPVYAPTEQRFTASGIIRTEPYPHMVPLTSELSPLTQQRDSYRESQSPAKEEPAPFMKRYSMRSATEPAEVDYDAALAAEADRRRKAEEAEAERRKKEQFYTFTKKNEEFEALLRQEYERAKAMNATDNEYEAVLRTTGRNTAPQIVEAEDLNAFEKMLLEGTEDSKVVFGDDKPSVTAGASARFDFLHDNQIKAADTTSSQTSGQEAIEQANRFFDQVATDSGLNKSERSDADKAAVAAAAGLTAAVITEADQTDKQPEPEQAQDKEPETAPEAEAPETEQEPKAEAEAPEEAEPEEPAETEGPKVETLIPEKKPETDEPTVKTKIFKDVNEAIGAQAFTKDTLSMKLENMRRQEAQERNERALAHQKKLDDMARARDAYFNGFGPGTDQTGGRRSRKVTSDTSAYAYDTFAAAGDEDKKQQEETSVQAPLWNEFQEEEPKKKHGFLKFLLALLIIAGLIEGSIFGINKFAPGTRASEVATEVQDIIVEGANFTADKAVELFNLVKNKIFPGSGSSNAPTDAPGEPVITSRGVDLTAVLAKSNKNIIEVSENTALKVADGVNYSVEGIGKMEVVTDPETLGDIYSALISYNSAWVDYVAEGDKTCLDYLKKDSAAYKSAVDYAGVGQVTETFDSLQLGEVRRDGDTYYLFSKENIRLKSSGGSENKLTYYWIYELEKIDGSYRIADYDEY